MPYTDSSSVLPTIPFPGLYGSTPLTGASAPDLTIIQTRDVCAIILNFNDVDEVEQSPDNYNFNPETGEGTYNDPGSSIIEQAVDRSNADFITGAGWQVALHTEGMFSHEGVLQFAYNMVINSATGAWSTWGFLAAGVFEQVHAIGETRYYGLRQDEGGGSVVPEPNTLSIFIVGTMMLMSACGLLFRRPAFTIGTQK